MLKNTYLYIKLFKYNSILFFKFNFDIVYDTIKI